MGKHDGFKTSILDYEAIRNALRFVYMYGCCTKNYTIGQGLTTSARKYEDDMRRLRAFIPEKYLNKATADRQAYLRVCVSALEAGENFLARSYSIRSLNERWFVLYFAIMQLLSGYGKLTASELNNKIDLTLDNSDCGEWFSPKTLQSFLGELREEGLIEKTKTRYSIARDRFKCFSPAEIEEVRRAVGFYKNVLPVGILGEHLYDSLTDYLCYERGVVLIEKQIFRFRYRHMQRIVDDHAMYKAFKCKRYGRMARIDGSANETEFALGRIIIDWNYGRQYLAMISRNGQFQVKKFDSIKGVEITDVPVPADIPVDNPLDGSWLTSYLPKQKEKRRIAVQAIFSFDPVNERHILRRLNKEKRNGTVTKLNEGKYAYHIDVTDPNEMLPWFRSFMGYVYIRKSDEHDLHQKYRTCIEAMGELYGCIQEI
jgi:hypothetical protein